MLREPLPHRGALISLEQRGKARDFSCVYQASKYDLQGNPVAIASKGGIDGKGGMPRSFCIKDHGPCKLRVGEVSGPSARSPTATRTASVHCRPWQRSRR
jgi:phenylpropionate dioxygenase-like ring-hydroxylating dioxygenase large terminal subunit